MWPIKVAADAPGEPLVGGNVTVDAMGIKKVEEPTLTRKSQRRSGRAAGALQGRRRDGQHRRLHRVRRRPQGGGGGLPVTGPAAGIGGVGGAVILALGLALFFLARRRRIVTVTPDA